MHFAGCHHVAIVLAFVCFTGGRAVPAVPACDVSDGELAADEELGVWMLQTSLVMERSSGPPREAHEQKTEVRENPSLELRQDERQPLHIIPAQHGHRKELAQSLAVGLAFGHAPGAEGAVVNTPLQGEVARGTAGPEDGTRLEAPPGTPVPSAERNSRIVLTIACAALVLAMSLMMFRCCGESAADKRLPQTDCGGLCPCIVTGDVPDEDLHSWEVSGEDVFGRCPSCLPWPRDLTARQWTWRIAEINVWIQVFVTASEVHQSYWMPRAVLKELQMVFAILMFTGTVLAVWWVHKRLVAQMLQYVFCSLITKALYVAAKYAVVASFVTACEMNQSSFAGCSPQGILAKCIADNSCTQLAIDQTPCQAPGADTCSTLAMYMPQAGKGSSVFMGDVIDMVLFLTGIVPVFMAALARESRGFGKGPMPEDVAQDVPPQPAQLQAPVPQAAMKNEAG
eukprot:gb/GFBE01072933.1/.p1 GENE.gb/GFBE01072933.1/~~gb/GFBE01072933.1/.p1  ORF type:complete len:454 (+),score=70.50 gb/GFBE01072933.1/:1-1362(+)